MDWTRRVRASFEGTSHTPDEDVIEELAQHARALYEEARAAGSSAGEADNVVARQLDRWRGEAGALRRRAHRRPAITPPPAAASSRVIGTVQDVRYAVRLLCRQPRPTLLTIVTMALGIAATTASFSVAHGVLMKPLPWPHGDRLVVMKETRGGRPPRFGAFTNAAYLAWRDRATTVEAMAAWSERRATLSGTGEPERIRIAAATASLFPVLGARPLAGTFFEQNDETSPLIVLSEDLWRRRFGADPSVLGRAVNLDGQPHTVVGILPHESAFPDRHTLAVVPMQVRPAAGNLLSMFSAVALLRPALTAAQAAAEGTARARHASDTGLTAMAVFGVGGPIEVTARPMREALTADVRQPLMIVLAAVGLLLVTATANVATLQLARAVTRTRELAIRAALGADGARLTRQLLVENLLVALSGGLMGLALTWWLHRVLPLLLPVDFPRLHELGIDAAVVVFALAVSAGTGVILGLAPALRARRIALAASLAEDGMAPAGAGVRTATGRARRVIMSAQVAIACVLLVGASLLGRSFLALLAADRGWDPSDVLSARLSMPETLYPAPERRFALVDQVLRRLAGTAGVAEAAFTSEIPLTPGGSTSAFQLRSRDADGAPVRVQASPRIVSSRYFAAIGLRTIAGRTFSSRDTDASEPVVIVNRTFARRYLGEQPLGARLPLAGYDFPGAPTEWTVIGVVDDVRYPNAADVSLPELYYSHTQLGGRLPVQTVTLLARAPGDTRAAAAGLRTAVREADRGLVADAIMPLEERLLATLARPRLYASLLAGFGGFALTIAAVGLFGLLSYTVSQRSRELAIRAALGARRSDLVRLVLGHGLTVTLSGTAFGLVASAWLARYLASQLYGVAPHDALSFTVVPVVLLACGALASALPASRAARVGLLRVLRNA